MPWGWLVTLGWRKCSGMNAKHQSPWVKSKWEKRKERNRVFRWFFPVVCWPVRAGGECCGHRDFRAEGGFILVCLFNMREKLPCCWREGASEGERNGSWNKGLEEKVWRREPSFASDTTESVRRMLSKYLKRTTIIQITPRCWAKKSQMLLNHCCKFLGYLFIHFYSSAPADSGEQRKRQMLRKYMENLTIGRTLN